MLDYFLSLSLQVIYLSVISTSYWHKINFLSDMEKCGMVLQAVTELHFLEYMHYILELKNIIVSF